MVPRDDLPEQQLTAEALVDLQIPHGVRLSPSGELVVYALSTPTRREKHGVSSLWTAEVGKESSARQLTSGLSKDALPQWSPDGNFIAFLSDRAKQGESSAIYLLPLHGGEAYPLTKADSKKAISTFDWSPNGQFIAFLSPDEMSPEEVARVKNGDDVKVYGENWEFNRLRVVHVTTREIQTLVAKDAHVSNFTWCEHSRELAYVLQETPEGDSSGYNGIDIERVALWNEPGSLICHFPGPISGLGDCNALTWIGDFLYFLAGATPNKANTSQALYKLSLKNSRWSQDWFGITRCARSLRRCKKSIAVQTQFGLKDQILLLEQAMEGKLEERLVYEGLHEISTSDVCLSDNTNSILVFGKGSVNAPTEIYSAAHGDACQLSQHGRAIAELQIGIAEPFYCDAEDDTRLDGVLLRPHGTSNSKPQPTVVLVHGGPYSRVTIGFNQPGFQWAPWLVSAGYTVLCPNYRGGSSHGEQFASAARGGMGTTDYSDVISLVKASITRGYVDKSRVAIGGWSQGGFLSYLAVTRPDFQFKAAVCGAGVTDWDMMSMTSDLPWFEAELAGGAPWELKAENTKARHGSAIWHIKDAKTPILVLHGEEDKVVPITQAIAFHRGCLHHNIPCETVTYPREGHPITERTHMLDMLKRIRRFYDLHLRV